MGLTPYERASDAFHSLLELPPSERWTAVARLDLDRETRDAVEDLLRHHTDDDFLQVPPPIVSRALDEYEPDEALPDSIGGYEVLRRIGVGGMGAVYEVVQEAVGRSAALKVMHTRFATESMRRRFQLEIDILARLQHPGIARIYDAGIDGCGPDARPYFVMELVDGVTVDVWADETAPSVDDVLAMALAIGDALDHAHQRGIIHRDVKPGNILVDARGRPRVLDFGIARPAEENMSLAPVTGDVRAVLGTLAYMSPEQCSPEEVPDFRTDVYSFGALICRLLSGEPPIDVADMSMVQAARRICDEEPRLSARGGRPLPRDLRAILLHALEKDPSQRYPSVSAMCRDIERFRRGEPTAVRPPSRWGHAMRWATRHPVAASAIASGTVVLAVLGSALATSWWLGLRPVDVVLGPEPRKARLVSRVGTTLATWEDVGSREPLVLERDAALGGGHVVLLQQHAGHLYAYTFDAPARVLWTTADLDFEPPRPQPSPCTPRLVDCRVDDYLPTLPGREVLVVTYLAPYGATAIRILDVTGEVRYGVWHDGSVDGVVFEPSTGRLVCGGHNSQATWHGRSVDLAHHSWPMVVYALELRDGHVRDESYIVSDEVLDPTVAFYRWAGPIEQLRNCGRLEPSLKPMALHDPYRIVAQFIIARQGDEDVYVNFLIDGHGDEVGRVVGDDYGTAYARGRVPAPEAWRLESLSALPAEIDG